MFENVRRFATEHVSSVNDEALLYQDGHIKSGLNKAAFFIPSGIKNVKSLVLTPVSSTNSNNLAAFAAYYEIANTTSVKTDLDAWAATVAYEEDNLVYDSVTAKAYICVSAHTSVTSFATGFAAGKWLEVPYTNFIKITTTISGLNALVDVLYTILGENKIVR